MKKIILTAVAAFAVFGFVSSASAMENYAGYYLKYGTKGPDANVMKLQQCLLDMGYANSYGADGYFGKLTDAQVRAYQAKVGVAVDGVVGPVTWAALDCGTSSTVEESTETTFTTEGEEADIKSTDTSSEDDADADATDQDVASFTIELDKGGALSVGRVDVMMEVTSTAGVGTEDDLWDIIDRVTLSRDGKEIASESTTSKSDWKDEGSDVYSVRLDGFSSVVESDDEGEWMISVDTANLADADLDISIDLDLNVRYTDEAGITETLDSGDFDTVSFDVVGATAGEAKLTESDDNKESSVIAGDADNKALGEEVLAFDIEAKDADITLEDLEVTFTVTGVGTDARDLIKKAYLYNGSSLVDSGSVSSTGKITFDLDEMSIDEDDTESFTVEVDLDNIDGTDVTDGATLTAQVTDLSGYDSNDDDLASFSDTTFGNKMTYALDAPTINLENTPKIVLSQAIDGTSTDQEDLFEAVFEISVDAAGEDVFLSNDAADIDYTALDGTDITVVIEAEDTAIEEDNSFKISADTTETFMVTFTIRAQGANEKITIDSFGYAFSDVAPTHTMSSGLEYFKTATKYLAK